MRIPITSAGALTAAGNDFMDGADEVGGAGILEYVAGGPAAEGLDDIGLVGVHREHDDPGVGRAFVDLANDLEAVEAGQAEIEQEDGGFELAGLFDSVEAVGNLAEDLQVLFLLQDRAQPLADDPVVVGQEQGDHCGPQGDAVGPPVQRRSRTRMAFLAVPSSSMLLVSTVGSSLSAPWTMRRS